MKLKKILETEKIDTFLRLKAPDRKNDQFLIKFNNGNWFIKPYLKIWYIRSIDELAKEAIIDGNLSRKFLIYKNNELNSGTLLKHFNDDDKLNEIIKSI